MIRAEYDSRADALSLDLVSDARAVRADEIDGRLNVALDVAGEAVSVELRHPAEGLDRALADAADRHGLDAEALRAAARAALAAPDREIVLEVRARAAA